MLDENQYFYVRLSNKGIQELIDTHCSPALKYTADEDYDWETLIALLFTKELSLCETNQGSITHIAEVKVINEDDTTSVLFAFDEVNNFNAALNEECIDELHDRLERYY